MSYQKRVSLLVLDRALLMRITIEFNDQLLASTKEIREERANGHLPAEFEAI